jgi:HSP20 family protein
MTMLRYSPAVHAPRAARFVHTHDVDNSVAWQPRSDVSELDDAYEVSVELPGIDRENVNVSFEDGVLKIEGEQEVESSENAKHYRRERRSGKFSRSFRVSEHNVEAENIQATFKNGVLTLRLPKAPEVLPRKIEITE